MNAKIEKTDDGRFAVTAGNTDEITDPSIDSGDLEENKLRAKYVHEAVNGRNFKKGEEVTILIPATLDGVEQLLDTIEDDEQTVEGTDIESLEAEIDQAVYDLFELTDEIRNVIEEYLDVF